MGYWNSDNLYPIVWHRTLMSYNNYELVYNGMCALWKKEYSARDFPRGRTRMYPPLDGVRTVFSSLKWISIDEKERLICDSTPFNRFCGVACVCTNLSSKLWLLAGKLHLQLCNFLYYLFHHIHFKLSLDYSLVNFRRSLISGPSGSMLLGT